MPSERYSARTVVRVAAALVAGLSLVVGGLLGIFGLVSFWIWLYYTAPRSLPIRSYGARRRWYRWWE